MSRTRTARTRRPTSSTTRAIGYVRVSTDGQVESGAGLDAQRSAITERATREGWDLTVVGDEGLSAKDLDRPALLAALDDLDAGRADVLVAAKLDRVSRSTADFSGLLNRARANGWRIVLLDLGVDTSTDAGRFVARTIANSAEYERDLISSRTRDGLAAKRAAGVRLGRPSGVPLDVVRRIVGEREQGRTYAAIVARLNADGVPTVKGKPWGVSSVQRVLDGQDAALIRAETA